jgi:hypothetical protein
MISTTAIPVLQTAPSTKATRSEWWFVVATIVIVLAATSLPYVYGYLSTPPDKQFMGIMLDVPDHSQYFSWMRELTHSSLASNKLTPEPNRPLFFNLLWWGMGRLGKWAGLDYAAMLQVLRVVAASLFLLLAYWMCARFFDDRLMRRTAFLVITLTSGFGWILILLKYTLTRPNLLFPQDVFIAEGNTFLGIMAYPHFIAAALYILCFDLILRGQAKQQLRYAVAAGLVAIFLGWQHAYDLVSVYGVVGALVVLQLLRDRRLPVFLIKSGLILGLISWWPALYSVILTSADPIWKQVLKQFANAGVYTPNLLHLPILLGPAFLLALFTAIKDRPLVLKGLNDDHLLLRSWFWITFALIYLPVDYQIHLINGWQVPIAILATKGLYDYGTPFVQKIVEPKQWKWSPEAIRRGLATVLIIIVLPTNLYLWVWRFTDLSRHDYPYYLYKDEIAAFAWLEDNAQPDDVVLSSLTIGQYIPAMTGTHAFLAHWAQTLDFFGKSEMVHEFFAQTTMDDRRQQIAQTYHVRYVFYSAAEQALGKYAPESSSFLKLVFSRPGAKIYAVQN